MSINYNPPSFLKIADKNLRHELDKFAQRISSVARTTDASSIQSPNTGEGYKWIHGSLSVTGSKTAIPTGLSTVTNCGASIQGVSASNFSVTCQASKALLGGIDIYVWMPTSSTDTTPTAATTAATVSWWAAGS